MIEVAKVLIKSRSGGYLLLKRSDHPDYPFDSDLPGGMIDPGEDPAEAAIREAQEEAGLTIKQSDLELLAASTVYSESGNEYILYQVTLDDEVDIELSWEHYSYAWLPRQDFLDQARGAIDSYMHMVHEIMVRLEA